MLWHYLLHPHWHPLHLHPLHPRPPCLVSVLFILTAMLHMSLPLADHRTQTMAAVRSTLSWMVKFELCSPMFDKRQRRHEVVWLKDITLLLQFTHSILATWSHYILMPSIANQQHQQNYSAKYFASHSQTCMNYSVYMEYYPANIEQILNDYLHQLICKLETIRLEFHMRFPCSLAMYLHSFFRY